MIFNPAENIRAFTPLNPYPRSADGRPQVPDDLLQRMRLVTSEEAWHILSRRNGYRFQFAGGWPVHLHSDHVLVGRAVTAVFVPIRPDLEDAVNAIGAAEGRPGRYNAWVIESLQPGDVLVADMFSRIQYCTLVGDNLSTRVRARTGTGMVLEGGFRDLHGLERLTDFPVYARGIDPSALSEATLVGVNIPARIGGCTVLPGDVVLGTRTGVTFVPPHMVQEVVDYSEDERLRDVWSKQQLVDGKYDSAQIDVLVWAPEIETDYQQWKASRN